MAKFTLTRAEDGSMTLTKGKELLATWGYKEPYAYVVSQCEMHLGDGDTLVESGASAPAEAPEAPEDAPRVEGADADDVDSDDIEALLE